MKRYIKSNQEIDIEEYVRQSFQGSGPGPGCTFIDDEGNYINIYPKLDVHEDLCEWVEDQLNIKLPYRDEEFFVREFNWIRLRSDPHMSIIELPSSKPNNSQWWALNDWLEYLEDRYSGQKVTLYVQVCDNSTDTDVPFNFGSEYFSDDMMKLLKSYYSTGRLYASTEGSAMRKFVAKTIIASEYIDSTELLDKVNAFLQGRTKGFKKFQEGNLYIEKHSIESLIRNYIKYFNRNIDEEGDGFAADWDDDDWMQILYKNGRIREVNPQVDEGNKKISIDGIDSIIVDGSWGTAFAGPHVQAEDYTVYEDIPDIRLTFSV